MIKKWKLIHEDSLLMIENDDGKTLGYNPNAGIKILEQDGYAFKDLNQNSTLELFEDWRQPMTLRVADFMKHYGLIQKDNMLYYKRGIIRIPKELEFDILDKFLQADLYDQLLHVHLDDRFLKDHYIFVILLLMFDKDDGSTLQDYSIQMFIRGIETGLLENILYSIGKSIKNYLVAIQRKPIMIQPI